MKKIYVLFLLLVIAISASAQNLLKDRNVINLNLGDTLQNIELPDCYGHLIRLSDYCGNGNYTVIDFGATWCIPSRLDTPLLKKYYDKYNPSGLNMVSIYADTKIEVLKRHVESKGVTWPLISELIPNAWDSKGFKTFSVRSIPLYLILDKRGSIIFMSNGSLTWGSNSKDVLGPKLYELYGY